MAEDAESQLSRLRAQVDALRRERVTPALASAAETAGSAIHDATETARHQAEALSVRVRQHPLLAVLIALAIGLVIGRALR
jgi:ElaB/YqjD/DUF883 family membrane-anchored ribosome-binding protein